MDIQNLTEQIAQFNPAIASAINQMPWLLPVIILQMIMKIIFYPIALYISAKNKQKTWFIVLFLGLLVLNDYALLPILYLIFNRNYFNKGIKTVKKKAKK